MWDTLSTGQKLFFVAVGVMIVLSLGGVIPNGSF